MIHYFLFLISSEGLSLFGIMNKCKTPVGKKLMREWFLRPLLDQEMIFERHQAVSYFLRPTNREFTQTVLRNLAKFKDLPRILGRIRSICASVSDWCSLFEVRIYFTVNSIFS